MHVSRFPHWVLSLVFIPLAIHVSGQTTFTFAELNAENLFDCRHDAGHADEEFLPTSVRRWNEGRLQRKLNLLGRTLAVIGNGMPPDLVALCEVENDSVMHRLTHSPVLWSQDYCYCITNNSDARGMNVALIYRPESFRPIAIRAIRPVFKDLPPKNTRDVLHVSGLVQTGDTLDVFVVHAPSRLDPHHEGSHYRMALMRQLRAATDSIMGARLHAQVILTGDFNATPYDAPLTQGLGAILPNEENTDAPSVDRLYNLTPLLRGKKHVQVRGSYFYNGTWELIDQFIVNGRLLRKGNPLHVNTGACRIADEDFLLTRSGRSLVPRRTYRGPKWQGGLSDHLPLVLTLGYSW